MLPASIVAHVYRHRFAPPGLTGSRIVAAPERGLGEEMTKEPGEVCRMTDKSGRGPAGWKRCPRRAAAGSTHGPALHQVSITDLICPQLAQPAQQISTQFA
jgi:hypothetical protein